MNAPEVRRASIASDASAVFAAQVMSHASVAALLIALSHVLGTDRFGLYRLALTIATIGAAITSQGIAAVTGRYLSVAFATGADEQQMAKRALKLKLACSVALALAMFALAQPIAVVLGEPRIERLIPFVAAIVIASDLTTWLVVVFQSTRRAASTLWMAAARSICEISAAGIFVWLGFGTTGAIAANGLGYVAAAAVGVLLAARRLSLGGHSDNAPTTREIVRFGRQIWYAELAFVGFATVDQLMLQLFRGTQAVGIYDAAWQLATAPQLFGSAVAAAVAPRLAAADRATASSVFTNVTGLLVAFYAAVALVVAAFARPIASSVLDPSFARSGDVFLGLSIYLFLAGLAPFASVTPNYLGITHGRARIALVTLVLNVLLNLALIPWLGVVGPALATAVAYSAYVGMHFRLCQNRLDLKKQLIVQRACAGVGAGMIGVLAGKTLFSLLQGDDRLRTLGAVALSVVVAGGFLVAFRVFRRDELVAYGVPARLLYPRA